MDHTPKKPLWPLVLTALADDELILAHRNSEWTGTRADLRRGYCLGQYCPGRVRACYCFFMVCYKT